MNQLVNFRIPTLKWHSPTNSTAIRLHGNFELVSHDLSQHDENTYYVTCS